MTILLDPTSERVPAERIRAPRLESLEGRTIGLLDIAKARGDVFLDLKFHDIPRTVALPAFSATEITALAYDPTTATLVVVSRARFTFYHVAAL